MNFKTTYILFGTLILVVVAAGLNQFFTGGKTSKADEVFPSIARDKVSEDAITRVEIDQKDKPGAKIVLERAAAGKPWRMTAPIQTRVDSILVDNLAREFVGLRHDPVSSEQLPRDLAVSGLTTPKLTVTVGKGKDQTWTLNLGNESPGTGRKKLVYVTSSDRPNEPLAIHHQDVEDAYKSVKELRSKTLVLQSEPSALEVSLNDGKTDITLVKKDETGKKDVWYFRKPELGEADYFGAGTENIPAGPVKKVASVRDLLVAIDQLRVGYQPDAKVDDFVADNVSDGDLKKYGLEKGKPATLRIEVKSYLSGLKPGDTLGGDTKREAVTDALLIGNVVPADQPAAKANPEATKEFAAAEKLPEPKAVDSDDDKYFYARLESENNVIKLPARSLQVIRDVLGDVAILRGKDLVAIDTSKADAIDIKNAQGTIQLRKVGEPEKWQIIDNGSFRDADQQAVTTLLNVLATKRQVKEYPTGPDDKLGLDDKAPTVSISLWEGAIKDKKGAKADETLGKAAVQLTFATKPEKEVLYVRRQRDAETARLGVPESILPRITEEKIAFFDKTLPSFTPEADVARISVVRPDGAYEFEPAGKKDGATTWKIVKPAELAGRTADGFKIDRLLDMVRNLHADKLAVEKPDADTLKKYGLEPGEYQVTVTLKTDMPAERKYTFGLKTEKGDGRYARMSQRDWAFLVRPEVIGPVDPTVYKDYVDGQVFRFDPAKIRAVKLVGLADGDKRVTLEAEAKPAGKPGAPLAWTVKTSDELKNVMIDAAKVGQFAEDLARLNALRFLVFKTGAKPEHKLGDKERALLIEITVEGEMKPVALIVGAPVTEGDVKGYAVQTSTLPGDVLLAPEQRFEKLLKEGVKYFAK